MTRRSRFGLTSEDETKLGITVHFSLKPAQILHNANVGRVQLKTIQELVQASCDPGLIRRAEGVRLTRLVALAEGWAAVGRRQ